MDRIPKKTLASRARHLVYIQEKRTMPDGEGGNIESWINLQRVFAEVTPMQARQVYEYKSKAVDATHFIKIRGKVEIAESNRLNYNDRIFQILTIENLQERDFELFITCLEQR